MEQGSTMKRSAVHNFAPTVTKFCVMWEGQALPHDTKFGNSRCEIVGRRVIFIWSLIHGLRWSGLIKVGPGKFNTIIRFTCPFQLTWVSWIIPFLVRFHLSETSWISISMFGKFARASSLICWSLLRGVVCALAVGMYHVCPWHLFCDNLCKELQLCLTIYNRVHQAF